MRIVALITVFNEELFIAGCIENFLSNGVAVHIIDNDSTDGTMEIVRSYLGKGVVAIDRLPRESRFELTRQLRHKEEIIKASDADWLIHADADEIRRAPPGYPSLAAAIAEVDAAGYNAVNFMEYTFVPTRQSPDHEHHSFQETMRWYYPFAPQPHHQVKAWKNQGPSVPVSLANSGGHHVQFDGIKIFPVDFIMRHYIVLSVPHALRKYAYKTFDESEVNRGWHGWRANACETLFMLPDERDLILYQSDGLLDPAFPRKQHLFVNLRREMT